MFGWFKKKPLGPSFPDFETIDTPAKAESLASQGQLEKVYLLPLEFGGLDNPHNSLYVPIGIANQKASIDRNVISPLAHAGTITEYQAVPVYEGKSCIPVAIEIIASNPGHFRSRIDIWGKMVQRRKIA